MFLTEAELERLTGRRQAAAQRRWLARNGVRFFVRADGRPSVPADQMQAPGKPRPAGPNLAALARLV